MSMSVTIEMTVDTAERYAEAIETVLRECDVHSDEAQELEELFHRISMKIEKIRDYVSEVEAY